MEYDRELIAREIFKRLENVTYRDWCIISRAIEYNFESKKIKSRFKCDKSTLRKVDPWC